MKGGDGMTISKPGVYAIDAATYHADPCPQPSLSASIAHRLLTQSPAHARQHHPRLNPNYQPEHSTAFDIGTAAHAMLLEGADNFAVIDAPDYRTKAAQQQRDAAYVAGQTPILLRQLRKVQAMVSAVRDQLATHKEAAGAFSDGKPEQTLVWLEGEVWCRARLDWMRDYRDGPAPILFCDLKTTEGSADPQSWVRRQLFSMGYDIQAAFYARGVGACCGFWPNFAFVVVETEPPYGLSVVGLPPAALHHASLKVERAISIWRECLARDKWPSYPPVIHWADLPAWAEAEWTERESITDTLAKAGVGI